MDLSAIGLRVASGAVAPLIKRLFRTEAPGAGLAGQQPVRIGSLVSFRGEKATLTAVDLGKLAAELAERARRSAGPREALGVSDVRDASRALAGTLRSLGDLDMTDVQAVALGADRLAETLIQASARKGHERLLLSQDAELLHERLTRLACVHIIDFFTRRSTFVARAAVEQARRNAEIIETLDLLVSRLPDQATADGLFEERYRAHLVGRHGRLSIFGAGLDEDWPLDDAYLSLELGGTRDARGPARRAELALSGQERVLLRGVAGSGKTTLVQWLAVTTAEHRLNTPLLHLLARVPFVLPLRTLTRAGRELPAPRDFLSAVACPHTPPEGWAERVLSAGRGLLLIDGVDEVPEPERDRTRAWLRELLRDFPGNACLVTARPSAVRDDWLAAEGFTELSLAPMSRADVAAFVHRWHAAARVPEEEANALIDAVRSRQDLGRLATNPLMCALICALHHTSHGYLPTGREELYDAALRMLLEQRDEQRKVRPALRLDAATQTQLLQALAYWLIRNGHSEMERADAVELIANLLPAMPRAAGQGSAEDIYRHLLDRSGLLREPAEGAVDFVHRTFQDYLAARQAIQDRDFPLLVRNAHLDQWEDVIRMAVAHGRPDERGRLLRALIKRGDAVKKHRVHLHLLAAACLEHATQLDPETHAEVRARAAGVLPPQSMEEGARLAEIGPVVLELLPGPEGLTADQAAGVVITARGVGGDATLPLLARYASHPSLFVRSLLASSWHGYDPADYAARVLAGLPPETLIRISSAEELQLVRGRSHLSVEPFTDLARLVDAVDRETVRSLRVSDADDLAPLTRLPHLSALSLDGGGLTDLAPLTRLPLKRLALRNCLYFTDLAPLALLPLERLELRACPGLTDLGPLAGVPLRNVHLDCLGVEDLTPLTDAPLNSLTLLPGPTTNLRVLDAFSPKSLTLNLRSGGAAPLRRLGSAAPVTDLELSAAAEDVSGLGDLPRLTRVAFTGSRTALLPEAWREFQRACSLRHFALPVGALRQAAGLSAVLGRIESVTVDAHGGAVDLAELACVFPSAAEIKILRLDDALDLAPLANLSNLQRLTLRRASTVLNAHALPGVELTITPSPRY